MLGLAAISAVGTVGYVVLEGLPWGDALYLAIITISTVGYGDFVPVTPAGRAFTAGLIVTGVSIALYLFWVLGQHIVEGRLRELLQRTTMHRNIDRLEDHVIICGYGRFGRVVVDELSASDLPVCIIEIDPLLDPELSTRGLPYLVGSATSDEILERAGIRRARAIVIGTSSDSDNVFITLAARERNSKLRIHARGESESVRRRLQQAGADQVVSAYHLGGLQMAASILRPAVVDCLELSSPRGGEEVDLEEIALAEGCGLDGCCIGAVETETPGVRIVALKRGGEIIRIIPDRTTEVHSGDHVVVIGERSSLERLARRAQGRS